MYYSPFQRRILLLFWDQFRLLIIALDLDIFQYNILEPPTTRLTAFETQISLGGYSKDQVEENLCRQLGAENVDELDRILLQQNVAASATFIVQANIPSASKALLKKTAIEIDCIHAAKVIHDTVQHQMASKLAVCVQLALALTGNPVAARPSARRALREMSEDLDRVRKEASNLQVSVKGQFELANAEVAGVIGRLRADLEAGVDVDMITPVEVTLKSYIAQMPSRIQDLLSSEVTSIGWEDLSKLKQDDQAESSPFLSIQRQLFGLVQDQREWQHVHDNIARVANQLENFFQKNVRARAEIGFILRQLLEMAVSLPAAAACMPLILALLESIMESSVDENRIRNQMEDLDACVSRGFRDTDNRLLGACGILQNISFSLQFKLSSMS